MADAAGVLACPDSGAGLSSALRRDEAAMSRDEGREVGEQRRRERLAAALRENLKRRKAQQRGRAVRTEAPNDETPDKASEGSGV
jgi:hypothetical protein